MQVQSREGDCINEDYQCTCEDGGAADNAC